jgi:uncharacterized protein (TIGR00266 family)
MAQCDVVDFKLVGDDLQAVVVTLDPGEQVLAEAGAFFYMEDGIDMQTSMSVDKNKGFFGNFAKAVGRMFTGEGFFVTTFTNNGQKRCDVSFSAPYPGKIIPMHLGEMGGEMLCQKDGFLCAARGTELSIAFQRKLGSGLFGGEGFILQKLRGDGYAFVHAGGTIVERVLEPGETLRVDTGCVVALQPTVEFDIQFVGGFKNALFGGEGLFFATLRGPGKVFLQTLPFSRLADRIVSSSTAGGKAEQGGIFSSFLGGDND